MIERKSHLDPIHTFHALTKGSSGVVDQHIQPVIFVLEMLR